MRKLSQAEANRVNLLRMVRRALGCGFGTLWWVPDELWDEKCADFRFPQDEGIRRHPGVCVDESGEVNDLDAVAMLFGTSGERGPVVARGLSSDRPPNHATSFGVLLAPAMLEPEDFFRSPRGSEVFRPVVLRNQHKPHLDANEMEDLSTFVQEPSITPASHNPS